MATLETHIINPTKKCTGSVIWMHGLGANNRDFDTLVPDLNGNGELSLRFVFPNAPIRPVHINQNMAMPAWYDIYSLTDLNREDVEGIRASSQAISRLIQLEIAQGVPYHRIVLAGYSQGGAMALYTGLRQPQKIAGVLALSCYLPLAHEHAEHAASANFETPVFIAHGIYDTTLPCFAGKMAHEILSRTHKNTEWHEYTMQHEIIPQETRDIHQWLKRVFA